MTAAPETSGTVWEATATTRPPAFSPTRVFLLAFFPLVILFGSTRARTVTGEDSGELIAAAYTLEIAHPPGYPLWLLLTKVIQTVCSGLNPADAASLGSAFMTAAALGLLAVVAYRVTRSVAAALVGAWATGVGHEVWNHATIAEVYPLNLLILAAALLLFQRWRETHSRPRLFALTLVYGCGLANHPTFHFFLPLFVLGVVIAQPRLLLDLKSVALALLGLALPHLAYLQVFIAAANDPFVSWGVEPDVRSVIGHYLREVYAAGPQKTAWTLPKALVQLRAHGAFISSELTVPGLVAACIGLALMIRADRLFGALCGAIAVAGTVGLLFVVDFDLEREEVFASRVFLMPAYLVLGLGLAATAARMVRDLHGRPRTAVLGVLLAVPLLAAISTHASHDRTNYYWSEDYAHALLDKLPRNAVLFPGGDTSTFPLIYLQRCGRHRRDVLIIDRSGTLERDHALALLPEEKRAEFADAPRDVLTSALVALSGRPIVTLRPERAPRELEIAYEPCGLGFLAVPQHDKSSKDHLARFQETFFKELRLRNEADSTVEDYTADVIRSHVAQASAMHLFRSGNPIAGVEAATRAARFGSGIKETLNNVASLLAENGFPEMSEAYFREALAIRGDYQLARRNLIITLRGIGLRREALEEAARGLAFDPDDRGLFMDGAELAAQLEDGVVLNRLCEARMRVAPDDPAPHRFLGEWALDQDQAPLIARLHLREAVKRDPNDKDAARRLRDAEGRSGTPDLPVASGDHRDRTAELAALLPPRLGDLKRAAPRTGRARIERGVDDRPFVPGADHMDRILEQLKGVPAFDPIAGMNVPRGIEQGTDPAGGSSTPPVVTDAGKDD